MNKSEQINNLIENAKSEQPNRAMTISMLMQAKRLVEELEIDLTAITRDRDEWKQATLDANKSIDTSHRRYKEMYADIQLLRNTLEQIVYNIPEPETFQEFVGMGLSNENTKLHMIGTIARKALKSSKGSDSDES